MSFESFPKIKKAQETPVQKTGTEERLKLMKKYHDHEGMQFVENRTEKENLENFMNYYQEHKILFHDGGMNARIFELPVEDNSSLVVKEMRKEKMSGFAQNSSEMELDFQDILHEDLELPVPLPVAVIEQTILDYDNKKMDKVELIIMEKIAGRSIGDYRRALQGTPYDLPEDFDLNEFMSELEAQVELMHKNNIYHRDLTPNNVLISEECSPIIIDFGTTGYSWGGEDEDPYLAKNQVVTLDGVRSLQDSRYVPDETNLITIRGALKEIIKNS